MIDLAAVLDRPFRFGARGSALSRAQTALVVARLRAAFPDVTTDIHVIRTEGDVDVSSPLTEIGGRGVFTSAIEAALVRGEVDAAVHSAKDLPTALHQAAPIVAFPDRDDPRDVLVSRHVTSLDRLPANPVIGTSSRRREVQIRQLRPDARIVSIRGNVDTRLGKSRGEDLDGVVLAAAGIRRLGWHEQITEAFPVDIMVPSPGQGAIAVQAVLGTPAADILARIDDPHVATAVRIERAFLAALGAGCAVPVGAYVEAAGDGWRLLAMLADAAGERVAYAAELLARGDEQRHAAEIANRLRSEVGARSVANGWTGFANGRQDLDGARVVVTRPRHLAGPLVNALGERGATVLPLPAIRMEPVANTDQIDAALQDAWSGNVDWLVFTSANAVNAVRRRLAALNLEPHRLANVNVAAVGKATAEAATKLGLTPVVVPATATAEALTALLAGHIVPGQRVLYPRSAIGRDVLPDRLRELGADVLVVDAYTTAPETDADPAIIAQVRQGDVDVMTFASPSSVNCFLEMIGAGHNEVVAVAAVCAGPVTAAAAREAGFRDVAVSYDPGVPAIVDAVALCWRQRAGPRRPDKAHELQELAARSAG